VRSVSTLVGAASLWIASGCLAPQAARFTIIAHCEGRGVFHGTYLLFSGGSSSSHDLSGRCPSEGVITYEATGSMVSAEAQKQSDDGTRLAIDIQINGALGPPGSDTRNPYGVVTAVASAR
jgi:hypothetical protein